jgi:hypothetical protein
VPKHPCRTPNELRRLDALGPSFIVVPDDDVQAHRGALAIFASVKRRGVWSLARRFRIAAVMAEAKLDLREVRIGAGRSDIEIFALWAYVEIIVPPGIHIDVQDSALMGDLNWEATESWNLPRDAPTVTVRGSVIMSSVEIKVRYVGESEKEAKKRIKAGTRG